MKNKNSYGFISFLQGIMEQPWFSILVAAALMFIFLVIVSLLSVLLAIPLFHLSYADLIALLSNGLVNANANLLKYFQIMQSLGLFVIPGILLYFFLLPYETKAIRRKPESWFLLFLLVIVILITVSPFLNLVIEWNSQMHLPGFMHAVELKMKQMESEADSMTKTLLSGKKYNDYLINMLMIAIIPAIGEELIFRGVLQQIFISWTKKPAVSIVLAAAIFSAIHMQFYGFVPRMLLGMLFGYFFYRTGTIWIAIFAHFLNNGFAVTVDFISKIRPGLLPVSVSEDYHTTFWVMWTSIIVTMLFMLVFYYLTKKRQQV